MTHGVANGGENPIKKRPSGGSGGAGGRVFAIADKNLETLHASEHHFNGQPGGPGGGAFARNTGMLVGRGKQYTVMSDERGMGESGAGNIRTTQELKYQFGDFSEYSTSMIGFRLFICRGALWVSVSPMSVCVNLILYSV